jgi:hypothetical protein
MSEEEIRLFLGSRGRPVLKADIIAIFEPIVYIM